MDRYRPIKLGHVTRRQVQVKMNIYQERVDTTFIAKN